MSRKSILLLFVLITLLWLPVLKAQSLLIKLNDGSVNTELLSSLQKLSFNENNLVLSFTNGSNGSYPLAEVQKLQFETETSIPEPPIAEENKLTVYPNPADQELHIKNIPSGTSMIFVYRMDGKLMMESFVSPGSATIDISRLQSGFYLLVANNQTVKFIKL